MKELKGYISMVTITQTSLDAWDISEWNVKQFIISQKSFSYIKLLWINELFITFPGKMNY